LGETKTKAKADYSFSPESLKYRARHHFQVATTINAQILFFGFSFCKTKVTERNFTQQNDNQQKR
jgi:hypothetical protein